MIPGYPLTWPHHIPRAVRREKGAFRTTLPQAIKNVKDSLHLFAQNSGKKIDGLSISSNVTLGFERPADPGVAVWFTWDGMQVCIPVDRYDTVAANLQAIHHVIEARRVELRHGTLALVRATFQGFLALPGPPAEKPWREVLEFREMPGPETPTAESIEARYRRLASIRHPDRPTGSHEAMAELNAARAAALREVNA